jgi:hypothetical protein
VVSGIGILGAALSTISHDFFDLRVLVTLPSHVVSIAWTGVVLVGCIWGVARRGLTRVPIQASSVIGLLWT